LKIEFPVQQRKIKLAFFLLIVFASPFLVKASHFLFVHHHHHKCIFSEDLVVVEKHEQCPVCAFDYAVHQTTDTQHIPENHFLVSDIYTFFSTKRVAVAPVFSFHLRAPPSVSLNS